MQPVRLAPSLDAARLLIDDLVAQTKIPGGILLVRRGGQDLLFHAAGWQDVERAIPIVRNSLFRIYSMTKPIMAAAIMALVDDAILDLETEVARFIPEFVSLSVAVNGELAPAHAISVRDLLTHTSGLTYWFQDKEPVAQRYAAELGAGPDERWRFDHSYGGLEALASGLAGIPLVDQPGERWHYGLSFDLAGLLVERASGMGLDKFLEQRFFTPLGMIDTRFWVPPHSASRLSSLYRPRRGGGLILLEDAQASPLLGPVPGPSGGSGLISTIDDYARFADMLRHSGRSGVAQILSEAAVTAMMTNQLTGLQLQELPALAAFGLGGSGEHLGFGLGGAVVIQTSKMSPPACVGEYGWGGAASTTFWVDPTNDLTVVFMTQVTPPSHEMIRDRLHSAIYD